MKNGKLLKPIQVGLINGAMLLASSAYASYTPDASSITISDPDVPKTLKDAIGKILGAVQFIGLIVGIAMIIYIGIKYLTAGAGQKAEVKSTMVPLLVGAILVMMGPTIANWIFGLF